MFFACSHFSRCVPSHKAGGRPVKVRGQGWGPPCWGVGFHMRRPMGWQWRRGGVSTAGAEVKCIDTHTHNTHSDTNVHIQISIKEIHCWCDRSKKKMCGRKIEKAAGNEFMWVSCRLSLPLSPKVWQVFFLFRHAERGASSKEHLGVRQWIRLIVPARILAPQRYAYLAALYREQTHRNVYVCRDVRDKQFPDIKHDI